MIEVEGKRSINLANVLFHCFYVACWCNPRCSTMASPNEPCKEKNPELGEIDIRNADSEDAACLEKPLTHVDHFVRLLAPREWATIGFLALSIFALHVIGCGTLLIFVVPRNFHIGGKQGGTFGIGLGVTAYTLGLRHAFDADHIAGEQPHNVMHIICRTLNIHKKRIHKFLICQRHSVATPLTTFFYKAESRREQTHSSILLWLISCIVAYEDLMQFFNV